MASKSSKKKVFITGGAGYIGTHVVDLLLKKGHKVKIYDRLLFGQDSIKDFKKKKNFEFVWGEIDDIKKLVTSMSGSQIVIHLAGLVGDPASKVDENLTRQINIVSTRTVKEIAKLLDVERFIFASSCSVYGASNRVVNENSKLNPVSLYAKTKIDSEQELLNDKDKNFHPVILRFATVFGHSRRPRFDLVANLFVGQAYQDGIITVSGSKQWRPFIHPKDIAEAVVKVIQAPEKKIDRQVFNVGDQHLNTTIGDLAYLVKKIVKVSHRENAVQISIKDDLSDQRNYKVSFNKIQRTLRYRAKITLSEGLKEIYDNFRRKRYKGSYKDTIYSNYETIKLQQGKF